MFFIRIQKIFWIDVYLVKTIEFIKGSKELFQVIKALMEFYRFQIMLCYEMDQRESLFLFTHSKHI